MKKITVLGGDNRQKILCEALRKNGFSVDTLGLFNFDEGDIKTSEIVILPVPTTRDGKTVFCPLTNRNITLESIENTITDNQLILCCNYLFNNKKCVDYGALDSYALLNAIPTAEGAVKLAVENTPFTLWQAKVLVIGFGRVGKILADRLKGMGALVTVTARKPAALSLAEALGFSTINTNDLNGKALNYGIIFNTVDHKVIEDENMHKIRCDLVIDLATKEGISLEKCKEMGINAIKAPGLPSKVAPLTAAEILSNTVLHIINSYN